MEPEARSPDVPVRRRAHLGGHRASSAMPVGGHDGARAVDRVRLALRAYEQRAERRAAVLALWRGGYAARSMV